MQHPLKEIFDRLLFEKVVDSQVDMANKLSYAEGYISEALKKSSISPKMQAKLAGVFGISRAWLASNGKEGSMFPEQSATSEPDRNKKRVRVLGEAMAGNEMELTYDDAPTRDEYIDVGDLLKDSEAAFIVYGNSMTPAYPSGCVIGIRKCCDNFIQPGETYLLVTKSNKVFKRLYYSEDKKKFVCFSDNTMKHEQGPMTGSYFYPPFEVDIEHDVITVYDVTGMIRRNRNSGLLMKQK